jgi:hypothetical protein
LNTCADCADTAEQLIAIATVMAISILTALSRACACVVVCVCLEYFVQVRSKLRKKICDDCEERMFWRQCDFVIGLDFGSFLRSCSV